MADDKMSAEKDEVQASEEETGVVAQSGSVEENVVSSKMFKLSYFLCPKIDAAP